MWAAYLRAHSCPMHPTLDINRTLVEQRRADLQRTADAARVAKARRVWRRGRRSDSPSI